MTNGVNSQPQRRKRPQFINMVLCIDHFMAVFLCSIEFMELIIMKYLTQMACRPLLQAAPANAPATFLSDEVEDALEPSAL